MTPELRQSIALRAREIQVGLNRPGVDPIGAAGQAKRLFEDAADAVRTRWMNLELGGYAEHVPARPLHTVLGVAPGDRLAAHVAAYRGQLGVNATPGQPATQFRHFFVEPLADLVATQLRVRASATPNGLMLEFGPEPGAPHYPRLASFTADVFERAVLGFVASLHLQLGALT